MLFRYDHVGPFFLITFDLAVRASVIFIALIRVSKESIWLGAVTRSSFFIIIRWCLSCRPFCRTVFWPFTPSWNLRHRKTLKWVMRRLITNFSSQKNYRKHENLLKKRFISPPAYKNLQRSINKKLLIIFFLFSFLCPSYGNSHAD